MLVNGAMQLLYIHELFFLIMGNGFVFAVFSSSKQFPIGTYYSAEGMYF